MSKRRIGSLLATITFLGVIVLAAFNTERIQDMILYHRYEPSSAMVAFVDKTGMSEKGRFIFFASQPSLETAESFNARCTSREKETAILGCYDGRNIYIYDIDEPRLAGIRSTTAAHEMLHAAYRRLSDSDKEMVNKLLEVEYQKLKGDEDLVERMDFYARTQPSERENELHSIIGTEVRDIGDELEEYYSRYFTNRSKVVEQRQRYYSVFKELRAQADKLESQIDTLAKSIEKDSAAYNSRWAALQGDVDNFNRRAEQGKFSDQLTFQRERQMLVARSAELEDMRASLEDSFSKYNRLVKEREGIATETRELNRSIDSNLEPAPSI